MRVKVFIKDSKDIERVQLPEDRGELTRDIENHLTDTVREMMNILRGRGFDFSEINMNITGYNYNYPDKHLDL